MAKTETLRCMEVFGGSEPTSSRVALGALDAWVEAIPHAKAAAGGDVYYISSCATGRITRLLVADVSGHGAGVAAIARVLRGLMREHVNQLDQRRFVGRMNDAFHDQSKAGTFATAVVMTYFAPVRDLTICNAGHPPPIWFQAASGRWSLLEQEPGDLDVRGPVRNVPLGIVGGQGYEQFRVGLAPEDQVLCYTDSLIEACDVATGEPLEPAGLVDVLNALPPGPAETLPARLLDALAARCGDALADDDVTIMLLAPNLAKGRMPHANPLLVPFVWLRRVAAWRAEGLRRLPWPDLRVANVGGAIVPCLGRLWRRG